MPSRAAYSSMRQQIDAVCIRHAAQGVVEAREEAGARTGQAVFVAAQHRGMHRQRGLLNDRAAERLARQAPGLADAALDLVQRGVGAGDVQARGDAGGEVVAVQRQQDGGGLERVQIRSPGRTVPARTGRNRSRRCRSRCRGAGRRRGSPAADASAWRSRAPRGAPAWWPVPRAWPGTARRTVSSSALVSTKFSRALASATASGQAAAGSAPAEPVPSARRRGAPVGDGRQPVQFGHVAYSLGRVPWGCSWRKWPDFAAGQRFAGALAGE